MGLDQQASAVYEAWYFSIYTADDEDYLFDFEKALTDFVNVTGVKKTIARKYIEEETKNIDSKYGKNLVYLAALSTTEIAVGIVSYAYEEAGLNEANATILEEAKKKLKDMDTQYEDETLYSILKEYYTNSMSYYNFVVSPSGSFSQLSSTINGYKATIEKNKQELSFIYEE